VDDLVDELAFSCDLRDLVGTARPLERAVRDGELVRVRRGAYATTDGWAGATAVSRQLANVAATRAAARSEPVFSHESAAALHGIPLIGEWPVRARITVPIGGGKSNASVERSQRTLAHAEIVEFEDGTRATSLLRTAVDLASTRTILNGIVAFSHLRTAAGVDAEDIAAAIRHVGPSPGIARARRALTRSTTGSESVLESLVVARCQDFGFAPPEQQIPVVGADGREYRVDFGWRRGRVLLEADGRAKYTDEQGLPDREALWAEKRREDAIRPTCDHFVRVAWEDAWSGARLEQRLRAAGVPQTRPRRRVLTY